MKKKSVESLFKNYNPLRNPNEKQIKEKNMVKHQCMGCNKETWHSYSDCGLISTCQECDYTFYDLDGL